MGPCPSSLRWVENQAAPVAAHHAPADRTVDPAERLDDLQRRRQMEPESAVVLRHARATLPDCFAGSKTPTFVLMIFCSLVTALTSSLSPPWRAWTSRAAVARVSG